MVEQDIIKNLKDVVRTQITTDMKCFAELLDTSKVIVTIIKGPEILTKIVKVKKSSVRIKREPVSPETVKKIKVAKKLLKDNTDMMYLLMLLAKVREYSNKVNLKQLSPEAVQTIKLEFKEVADRLSQVQKQLE